MEYDEGIEARVLSFTSSWEGAETKEIYGGTCLHLDGNMFCGVWDDYLILRLGPAAAAKALRAGHVRHFKIKGAPLNGWVMVQVGKIRGDDELVRWLTGARDFVCNLPARRAS